MAGVDDDDLYMADAPAAPSTPPPDGDRSAATVLPPPGDPDRTDGDQDYPANGVEEAPPPPRRDLLPTGCCYDDRMKLHVNIEFNPNSHHPEDPRRIEEIFKAFKRAGLVFTGREQDLAEIMRSTPTKYMWRIAVREATREEICKVHTPSHFEWVMGLRHLPLDELRAESKQMDQGRTSIYLGSLTWFAALLSAGGAIDACKNVVEGTVRNAFAVIRPPGHHAEYDRAMGFCFFNNVPIAVRVCQAEYPDRCRRVMILDWDVHHGNGTQNYFYSDPSVLYVSIHVWEDGRFYPGSPLNDQIPDGGLECVGTGPACGLNVNIPWRNQGMGDGEYMAAFQRIVMPIGQEFDPDLVVISAGFDAADGDDIGACFVSPACYAHMTHMLMSLADGKVAVCLEGGYNLEASAKSALAVARTLMGEPPPRITIPALDREAARILTNVQACHAPYWESMRDGVVNVREVQDLNGTRLHDVIRDAQLLDLQARYQMIPLYIQRQVLYRSYENQVLVTPNIAEARTIFIVIHDTPELLGQPDPVDMTVNPHHTWVVDPVKNYLDWAIHRDYGVIDINVPSYMTRDDDTDAIPPILKAAQLEEELKVLMCYLWDNHLQLFEANEDIIIVGVGHAYAAIKMLLIHRETKSRIRALVGFITGTLMAVRSEEDPELAPWYKDHALLYLSTDHSCWTDETYTKRMRKPRYGTVVRSTESGLSRMMMTHASDAQRWILAMMDNRSSHPHRDNGSLALDHHPAVLPSGPP